MTGPIKLYSDSFWISPYGFSCFVALREKEIPFEYVPVSLADKEQRRPEFRDRAITGKVPMLEHGDFCLAESSTSRKPSRRRSTRASCLPTRASALAPAR